jgi:hypothetical protein
VPVSKPVSVSVSVPASGWVLVRDTERVGCVCKWAV